MRKELFYLLLGVLLLCCEPSIVSPKKYLQMVEKSLVVTQNDHRFHYEVQYQPSAYRALQALDKELLNEQYFTKELDHLKGHQYFRFRISTLDGIPIKEILRDQEVMNTLRFRIKEDFVLRYGQEIYPCVLYHLIDSGLSNQHMEFMCVFNAPTEENIPTLNNDLIFSLRNEHISTTPLDFIIEKQLVNQLPSIRL